MIQTRRTFIGNMALASAGIPFMSMGYSDRESPLADAHQQMNMICAFSKIFDALGEDMFSLLADAGFEGVDLTVRPGGYVSPENVERDLPKAILAAQKRGLSIPMIATNVTDASNPLTKRTLQAASQNGVKYYRLGYLNYDPHLDIAQNLESFRNTMLSFCTLNMSYGLQADYQNHVGGLFGSPVWDLWNVIKDMDSRYIGCQYDVRHAVVEGFTSWQLALKALCPHIGTLCIKDFIYEYNHDKWRVRSVPLGTGVVDFETYFKIIQDKKVSGPASIHFEFPLLDQADESLPKKDRIKKMLPAVKKEVDTLRIMMKIS